jgi:hypothetical protein
MPRLEADFFGLAPEAFPALDLTLYSEDALKEMSYFIWTMYQDDAGLQAWRTSRLLPLVQIDSLGLADED